MNNDKQKLIAERAYYYFVERGGAHGYHIEDWCRAELEITNELEKKSSKQQPKVEKTKVAEKSDKQEKNTRVKKVEPEVPQVKQAEKKKAVKETAVKTKESSKPDSKIKTAKKK